MDSQHSNTIKTARIGAYIYITVAAFYGLIILVYKFHKWFPVVLGYFLRTQDLQQEIIQERWWLLLILLPLTVPILGIAIEKFKKPLFMMLGVVLIAIILGTTGAILLLNSESDFILIPIGAVGLTFLITGLLFFIDFVHAFSRILHVLMLIEATSFVVSLNQHYGVEWYEWIISFGMLFLLVYMTFTPRDFFGEPTEAESRPGFARDSYFRGVHLISFLSLGMFYPHIFAAFGTDQVKVKRRWMGPEDGR